VKLLSELFLAESRTVTEEDAIALANQPSDSHSSVGRPYFGGTPNPLRRVVGIEPKLGLYEDSIRDTCCVGQLHTTLQTTCSKKKSTNSMQNDLKNACNFNN
jgi:hypothetical protein